VILVVCYAIDSPLARPT
jgi:translation initiation factor IF-3